MLGKHFVDYINTILLHGLTHNLISSIDNSPSSPQEPIPLFLPLDTGFTSISLIESYTLTCPLDLDISPDSSEKSQTGEDPKTLGTLAIIPSLSSPDQLYLPSSPLNLTPYCSKMLSEPDLSSSASPIRSTQPDNSSDIEELFNLRAKNQKIL